ncbi:MAG: HNH endonuclease signature motif containing protein [Bacteriovoracaceae bacterium]
MQENDLALLENTQILVKKEKEFTVQILRNLQEIERKKLFVELGFNSLHGYCVETLGYSSSEAYLRISAMRVMRDFHGVEAKIKSGALSLTVVGEMQMLVVNKEKSEEVKVPKNIKMNLLKELEGKSTRVAQKIVKEKLQIEDKVTHSDFKFKEETIKKFKKLSDKMGVENLDDLLLLLIKEKDDQLVEAKVKIEENSPAPEKNQNETNISRYIPLKIKRQVYMKANYQCEKCKSRKYLNVDHLKPFSLGGKHDLSNLRVLCSPCNQRERVKTFGNVRYG